MNIQQEDNGKKGMFYVKEEGEVLAEMTYTWAGEGMFIIDHTEVSEKLKGLGVGKQLVTAAMTFARKLKLKILPLCPFARSVFEKTPEFADVLR